MNRKFFILATAFSGFACSFTGAFAQEAPARPINLIINPKGNTGATDPSPQIIGHVGNYLFFTASPNGKTRKIYAKAVVHTKGGIDLVLRPEEIATKKYPLKPGPVAKGDVDNYVAEYDFTDDAKSVGFFHEKGKGLWRIASHPFGAVFLKKTDTDPTGQDADQMLSDVCIIDEVGQYPEGNRKQNLFPLAIFAAPNKKVGKELWVTNGTPGGTKVLDDIDTNSTGSKKTFVAEGSFPEGMSAYFPELSASYGGRAYFTAYNGTGYDLYEAVSNPNAGKHDPRITISGLFERTAAFQFSLLVRPTGVTATPQGVFFVLPITGEPNGEVWGYTPSDPTTGPYLVGGVDTNPGDLSPENMQFYRYCHFGDNQGYSFSGTDATYGREPYVAGNFAGAYISSLGDINAHGSGSSNPRNFTQADNTTFFVADPGDGNGEHLYRTNGTPDGYQDLGAFANIRDITPAVERFSNGDGNGGRVYFVADDPTNNNTPTLWQTVTYEDQVSSPNDSETPVRVLTAGFHPILNPTHLSRLVTNGIAYLFFVCDGAGTEYETTTYKSNTSFEIGHQVWYVGEYADNNP